MERFVLSVPEDVWPEYSDAVWSEFNRRSGRAERLMGAGEWWVLRGWLRAGIPLRIVLRGMSETRLGARNLSYYGPSVRAAYEQWRQALSGAA